MFFIFEPLRNAKNIHSSVSRFIWLNLVIAEKKCASLPARIY